jgi:FkbM family methyltransferase
MLRGPVHDTACMISVERCTPDAPPSAKKVESLMLLKNPILSRLRKQTISRVKKDSIPWKILYSVYSLGFPKIPFASIQKILKKYAESHHDVYFVYIGANDGLTDDLIRRHIVEDGWKGILVEPIRSVFEHLKLNYKAYGGLIFENAAIADKEESRLFYIPRDETVGVLASFSREVVVSTPRGATQDLIVEEVQCTTIDKLLRKHGTEKLDLILIDTEGADWEIIKSLSFDEFRPSIIIFERNNLTFSDYKNAVSFLRQKRYELRQESNNVIAVDNAELTRTNESFFK